MICISKGCQQQRFVLAKSPLLWECVGCIEIGEDWKNGYLVLSHD